LAISSLTTAKNYDFRIYATNDFGKGAVTTGGSELHALTFGIPDAPAIPTLAQTGTDIDFTWVAPAYNGGAPITDYKIEFYDGATYSPDTTGAC
jgi:hypothetical protein